jgi:hypothetical protein
MWGNFRTSRKAMPLRKNTARLHHGRHFQSLEFFPFPGIRVASAFRAVKFSTDHMTQEPQAIEVEVVEIDGITPTPGPEVRTDPPPRQPWNDWQNWQGQVRRLDARWWPLWVVLGTVVVFLLLTVGVVLGILFLILRIIRGILRTIFR